jgi:archaellum component FlaC
MDEKDFKRLLEASAAETQKRFDETTERISREMRTFVDTNAAETRLLFDTRTAEITARFDTRTAEITTHFNSRTAEITTHFDTRTAEITNRFDTRTIEITNLFETRTAELKQYMDETARDLRLHFDIKTEEMKHQVQLVAESVLMVNDKLDREAADIRAEMRQGFADTQAMIKFSHAELDRRILAVEERARTLEESVHRLAARMDRLEAMTATQ